MSMIRFDAVDASDPQAAAAFLDLATSLLEVERWKRFSHDLLEPRAGDRVLDIGCGTGTDALALAHRVGHRGQVTGVDLSHRMVKIAQIRAASLDLPVKFQQGDIHNLPFAAGHFDRTRIDRVLHFLPHPAPALREALRVTAPGGRIVITEPDWGTLTVEGGDSALTSVVLRTTTAQAPARIGAILTSPMKETGWRSIERHDSTLEIRDYRTAATLFELETLASRCAHSGRITAKDAVRWLRSLQHACACAAFRSSLGGVIASGIRPL